jgi:hypothetical protein
MNLIKGIANTLAELFNFLLQRKRWWLIPILIVLFIFAGLIILGSVAGIGPFIYTIF